VLYSWLLRTAPVFLLASSAMAQNAAQVFAKAPPEVDEALRARITKFYQAQVDGKARQAEDVVAEDSKDFFYNMAKPKFLSFEIRDITYSDNFTKAKVMMVVETYVMMPGFEGKPMKVPGGTFWKIENGQWCWYIPPDVLNATPFGTMKPSNGAPGGLPDLKNAPTVASLGKQVQADKLHAALLAAGPPTSDKITIHNAMPGSVRIELRHADVRGLEIKADRTEIPAGENAVVSFHYVPGNGYPPRTLNVDVAVEPINTVLHFLVTFDAGGTGR
jgi:hypothetical protein